MAEILIIDSMMGAMRKHTQRILVKKRKVWNILVVESSTHSLKIRSHIIKNNKRTHTQI